MSTQEFPQFFDQEMASSYDEQRARLAPIKDTLHLFTRVVFSGLATNARMLCVGAGTGGELIFLAQAYPGWRFTVIEPSPAMMKLCRQQAETHGITSRCTFHEGYLDSLPESGLFDGATSLLVSHFIVQKEARIRFFAEIAERLCPGAFLVNADLASDTSSNNYMILLDHWLTLHRHAGIALKSDYLGRDVAVLPAKEIESVMVSGGFSNPVLLHQALLIHAWHSKAGFTEEAGQPAGGGPARRE